MPIIVARMATTIIIYIAFTKLHILLAWLHCIRTLWYTMLT